jgi:predicted ATP-grasp superfamily ATP-dependent carboligase
MGVERSAVRDALAPNSQMFGSVTNVAVRNQTRPTKARVLVTDGEQRASLAVVRSLGRAGYDVFIQASRPGSLAGVSRFASGEIVASGAREEPTTFAQRLAEVVRAKRIDVVIPITDAALQLLLPMREILAPAVIPFGSAESHVALSDKRAVIGRAAEFGLAAPMQRFVERREDLVTAVAGALRFPVVLKPSCSVRMCGGELCKLDAVYAHDVAALEAHARSLDDAAFPLLVQERIVGSGMGAFFLMWDGRSLARFSHRRLRERPPSGGEMVLAESVPLDAGLAERCEALLRASDWRGPAMVEFKLDRNTGTPYLMEVNARFWGGLQLAVDSGVDFPALLAGAALGAVPTSARDYVLGQRLRWFWGDVDHLAVRLRHSTDRLNMPGDWSGGRLSAVGAFTATTLRGETDAIFRRDDPRPFARESRDWYRARALLLQRSLRDAATLKNAATGSAP